MYCNVQRKSPWAVFMAVSNPGARIEGFRIDTNGNPIFARPIQRASRGFFGTKQPALLFNNAEQVVL
jgi:hypothetical protein